MLISSQIGHPIDSSNLQLANNHSLPILQFCNVAMQIKQSTPFRCGAKM